MTPAYDNPVSPRKWNLALLALALTVIGGTALAAALLLSAANPPHAANLVYNATNADDFSFQGDSYGEQDFRLPLELTPPFTVEMIARNSGAPDSAWGLAASNARGDNTTYSLMIDNAGYIVTSLDEGYTHFEFPPILRGDFNHFTLHFDANGFDSFRVNDEFFRSSSLSAQTTYRIWLVLYRAPKLEWKSIKVYTG